MKIERPTKTVYVYRDRADVLDGKLVDAISVLSGYAQQIPEAYRHLAQVDTYTDSSGYSDSEYAYLEVFYHRPMTDEELAKYNEAEAARQSVLKKQELAQLARLQSKYGKEAS